MLKRLFCKHEDGFIQLTLPVGDTIIRAYTCPICHKVKYEKVVK